MLKKCSLENCASICIHSVSMNCFHKKCSFWTASSAAKNFVEKTRWICGELVSNTNDLSRFTYTLVWAFCPQRPLQHKWVVCTFTFLASPCTIFQRCKLRQKIMSQLDPSFSYFLFECHWHIPLINFSSVPNYINKWQCHVSSINRVTVSRGGGWNP